MQLWRPGFEIRIGWNKLFSLFDCIQRKVENIAVIYTGQRISRVLVVHQSSHTTRVRQRRPFPLSTRLCLHRHHLLHLPVPTHRLRFRVRLHLKCGVTTRRRRRRR